MDQSEQKASPAMIIGLLATAIGSIVAAILIDDKSSRKATSLGARRGAEPDWDDLGPEFYERPSTWLDRFVEKAGETKYEEEETIPFQHIPGRERGPEYVHQPDDPLMTEADIHQAARCLGPHYRLRLQKPNWCIPTDHEEIPEWVRDQAISYLESKGFRRPG